MSQVRADEEELNHQLQKEAKRLFEKETFGGNGRTCLTCHSGKFGTVSPADALERFLDNPNDPLFVHDGSDDFQGNGVTRMLTDATVLLRAWLCGDDARHPGRWPGLT
jgi:cytochrome c peroxidase